MSSPAQEDQIEESNDVTESNVQPQQDKKSKEANAPSATREPGKSLLPFSRVQKIIKADKELPNVAREAAYLISIATEEFIKQLAEEIYISAQRESRVTVQYRDVASIVRKSDKFMFLDEIIPWQNPYVPGKRKTTGQNDKSASGRQTTTLDGFVQKTVEDAEEPDSQGLEEDVVMNEDGTMTVG